MVSKQICFASLFCVIGCVFPLACQRDIDYGSNRVVAGNDASEDQNRAGPDSTGTYVPDGSDLQGAEALDSEELAFLTLINNYREDHGMGPLQISVTLTKAASWMSADMAEKGYFDHSDSLGRSFFVRLTEFGYPLTAEAENIAAGHALAGDTFFQWKNSPGHNANMLNSAYTAIGIGRAYSDGSPYGWYWTTDFGDVTSK